jgi:hypothetical protein
MELITIDPNKILVVVLYICAAIGIFGMILFGGYMMHALSSQATPAVVPEVQPVPAPTPAPVPTYPTVLTFTVAYLTTGNGHLEAITDAGDILYFADFSTYNSLNLHYTYTGFVSGKEGAAYDIGGVNQIGGTYTYSDLTYYDNYQPYDVRSQHADRVRRTRDVPAKGHTGGTIIQVDNRLPYP